MYDQENLYQQRKVIAELSPGDFFILPPVMPKGLRLYARSYEKGVCSFTLLDNLLATVDAENLLSVIGNKISYSLVQLSRFEKDQLKLSLRRPELLVPDEEIKLSSGKMGLSGENYLWVAKEKLSLQPSPINSPDNLPKFLFLHEENAVINESEEFCKIHGLSTSTFFSNPGAPVELAEQFTFHWSELCHRWENHLLSNKEAGEEHSARNDVYTQSVRSRLLNLLSGQKSYLPKTNNHILRAGFILLTKMDGCQVFPKTPIRPILRAFKQDC